MKTCTYAKRCGGCQYQGIAYSKQIEMKQKKINQLFAPFKPLPFITMEDPFHYRHKIFSTFSLSKTKKVVCGIYEEESHRVVPLEDCLIQHPKANEILNSICTIANQLKIKPYDEDRRTGVLRHAYLRISHKTQEILLVFVLGQDVFPGSKEFMKRLRALHPDITTCMTQVNKRKTSVVLGDREKILWGKGFIHDSLCNTTFKISSKSFYQVNPLQTEKLYQKAIELAALSKNEVILDAYCGIGTLGLIAAPYVHRVVGVEVNPQAIQDAIINAKINTIKTIRFFTDDATDFIQELVQKKEKIDTIFIDPPRAGSTENFLKAVQKLQVKKIIYISCNPLTQKRDISLLKKLGYTLKSITPVDMFPFTKHIETVALLVKK